MEETKSVDQQKPAPKIIEQRIFNALLNRLLFNTGFHVAASVKEKPRFEGDFTVYHVNIIVNNSVIDYNSELMAILNANCNVVQLSNDSRYPNQVLVGAEIYVQPALAAVENSVTESSN